MSSVIVFQGPIHLSVLLLWWL